MSSAPCLVARPFPAGASPTITLTLTSLSATFRLVVFRPFAGEVLVGKIMGSDEVGIRGEFSTQAVRAATSAPRCA